MRLNREKEVELKQIKILDKLKALNEKLSKIEHMIRPHPIPQTQNFKQRYLDAINKNGNNNQTNHNKEIHKLKNIDILNKLSNKHSTNKNISKLDPSFLKSFSMNFDDSISKKMMVKNKIAENLIQQPMKKSPLQGKLKINPSSPIKNGEGEVGRIKNKLDPELINKIEKIKTDLNVDTIKCFKCKQYIKLDLVNEHLCMMDMSFTDMDRSSLSLKHEDIFPIQKIDLSEWIQEEKKITTCQSLIRTFYAKKKYQKILKMSKKRVLISNEILQTEEVYCSNLCALLAVYHKDLKKKVGTNQQILSETDILYLFGNIEQITQVNLSFLEELQKQNPKNPNAKYGSISMKMGAFFKMYSMYIQNYNQALKMLQNLRSNQNFCEWANKAKTSNLVKQRSIEDFLIMPIQRVPRYNLLISELLRSTWEEHPDYLDIKSSLLKISEIAGFLNERKREFDYKSILLTLQNIVNNDNVEYEVIKPGRNFSSEGVFRHLDGECFKVFLFTNSVLILFNPKGYEELEKMRYKFHSDITLEFSVKSKQPGKKNPHLYPLILTFNTNKSFILYCKDQIEQDVWYNKFNCIFKEYKNTIDKRNSYHNVFHPGVQSPFKQKDKKERKLFFVEVWENERWVGGWSPGHLLPEIDRTQYSDDNGNTANKDIWLEIGFIWNSNWELVINETSDKFGWKYGFNWGSHFFAYQKNRSFVRKRLWRRTMYLSSRKTKKVSEMGDKSDVELDNMIAFGDVISIATNLNPKKFFLHSHNYVYSQGSKQQQISCFNGEDGNNLWKITRCHNKEINILDTNTNNDYVFHDSYVCLEHVPTKKYLTSCISHSSPSKTLQEVSCTDKNENDEKQEWKILIDANQREMGPLVIGQPFMLFHPLTKAYMVCEGKEFIVRYVGGIFPSYQKEVGAKKDDPSSYWCVKKIYEKNLLDQEFLFVED